MDSIQRHARLVNWNEIRKEVYAVNRELAQIIDELNPDNSYKFVLAEYLYGDITVNMGTANLPTAQGNLAPINSGLIDNVFKKELSYKLLPLTLILDKTSESFLSKGNHAIPLNTFNPGMLYGTYEMMDYIEKLPSRYNCWNFSAGARSIIMLPKITDSAGLRRLTAEYCISTLLSVNSLDDHWLIFKLIAQSKFLSQIWKSKVLYFGEKWLSDKNDSFVWLKFRNYLIKQAWIQILYVLSKSAFGFAWGKYAEAIVSRKLKPPIHLLDQLKHVLAISKSIYSALQPADDKQQTAPTEEIKKAFVDIYMLKEYLPTIMVANEYTQATFPAYYSLLLSDNYLYR